jgi:hypothetical protein
LKNTACLRISLPSLVDLASAITAASVSSFLLTDAGSKVPSFALLFSPNVGWVETPYQDCSLHPVAD